ncbi:anti sigma factor C-terminal domain-containing protein [Paenibacillus dokdonensis]|uniref:Anti sigma factor C-terminal domain-containing protein n=1 Tax=Paenibacillus dokdonensis TaxID=2567944 RepID=A0ABU6GUK0_9BACL|nr:anti sigma factor C-terminal domain-containing protein [Paenibacillus dokdonensis]MEC0243424.1 anti sigma factor C-terminal domain-containing protein [Paenibacillus dokdonensis]
MNHDFSDELGELGKLGESEEKNFHKLLKKTKRKTMLRNVIISVICTVLVMLGLLIANRALLSHSLNTAYNDMYHYKLISDPNVNLGNIQSVDGIWNGTAEFQTYKIIEGIPLPWSEKNIQYNVLNHFSLYNGGYSPLSVTDPKMVEQGMNFARSYNMQNGQRELLFYHPAVHYTKMLKEVSELGQIDPEKRVELAISFDRSYTSEEIRAMLPEGIHARWFWVDTYSADYVKYLGNVPYLPISCSNVFGYSAYADQEDKFENNEEKFIEFIHAGLKLKGNYDFEYHQIFDKLRDGKAEPTKEDVQNIGVVVTGSPESLQALQAKSYVRAAVLGAIVEKY